MRQVRADVQRETMAGDPADRIAAVEVPLELEAAELADIFDEWNRGPLESFLIEITANIFRRRDDFGTLHILHGVRTPHDLLYREQDVWSKAADTRALFRGYAGMLGLNLDRFEKDMEGAEARERVASDKRRGTALGVHSTPTIFINNRQIPTPIVVASLRTAIDAALKPQPAP